MTLRYAHGVHGGQTNIPAVYEDIFRWLEEEAPMLPDLPEVALSQQLAPGDGEFVAPNLDGTVRTLLFSDDPGL